jgi:hypothetical protein
VKNVVFDAPNSRLIECQVLIVDSGLHFYRRLTARSSRYAAYAFGLFVFAVGIALDFVLMDMGAPRPLTLLFDDFLTGVAAAFAAWFILRTEVRRRQQEIQRLRVLDETNHHVRNALQVMVLHVYSMEGPRAAELQQAVSRIEWTMNEVLPKIGPHPERSPLPSSASKTA